MLNSKKNFVISTSNNTYIAMYI